MDTYDEKQWAAVTIQYSLNMVAPHKLPLPVESEGTCSLACHGNAPYTAAVPPTILVAFRRGDKGTLRLPQAAIMYRQNDLKM